MLYLPFLKIVKGIKKVCNAVRYRLGYAPQSFPEQTRYSPSAFDNEIREPFIALKVQANSHFGTILHPQFCPLQH